MMLANIDRFREAPFCIGLTEQEIFQKYVRYRNEFEMTFVISGAAGTSDYIQDGYVDNYVE